MRRRLAPLCRSSLLRLRASPMLYRLSMLVIALAGCGGPGGSSGGGSGSASVTVRGLAGAGLVLAVDGRSEPVAAGGSVSIGGLAGGRAYPLTIAAQPAGQTCWVDGAGTVTAGGIAAVHCFDAGAGRLRISEVSVCTFAQQSCWLELTNVGDEPASLAEYTLRSSATGTARASSFALPDVTVPPGGYLLVRGSGDGDVFAGPGVALVGVGGGAQPLWSAGGFAELIYGGFTVDYVGLAGPLAAAPGDPEAWNGAPVAIGSGAGSAQRDRAQSDGNRAADWTWRAFTTPAGPNDVTSDVDDDADGIPDCAEQPGGTLAGLDLYGWGARAGQPDIFIELDWMAGNTPGLRPIRAALDKVVAAFAAHGYAVHFDVGALFGAGPDAYNLGGGEQLPAFSGRLLLGGIDAYAGQNGTVDLYALKAAHFDPRRRVAFHYAVAGMTRDGLTGVGEMPGNDFALLLGGAVDDEDAPALQAATIMHELGHNLGLMHGGDVATNFIPNYLSVMNYLYVAGLPQIGDNEGDRYEYNHYARGGGSCDGVTSFGELTNPPTDLARFVIDYSNGSGGAIDEHAIDEAAGLRRGSSRGVDFNCDGQIGPVANVDINGDGQLGTLRDHDDWGHITLVFQPTYSADSERLPGFDRSPIADERRIVARPRRR